MKIPIWLSFHTIVISRCCPRRAILCQFSLFIVFPVDELYSIIFYECISHTNEHKWIIKKENSIRIWNIKWWLNNANEYQKGVHVCKIDREGEKAINNSKQSVDSDGNLSIIDGPAWGVCAQSFVTSKLSHTCSTSRTTQSFMILLSTHVTCHLSSVSL